MIIRETRETDWHDVYKITENNMFEMQLQLGLPWKKESIVKHFQSKSVLVCENNNEILGFIAFDTSSDKQMIHSLQISAQYQNGLVGFRLLKAALMKGQCIASSNTIIACSVFENNHAKKQYFSLGFIEISRHQGVLSLQLSRDQLLSNLKLL